MKIKLSQSSIEKYLESLGKLAVKSFRKLVSIISTKKFDSILQISGWLLLLAVSIYVGTQASMIQQTVGDQFISTYIFGDALRGAPMISDAHTNIIKMPFLWMQYNLGYTLFSYVALNVFFIFSSIALWIYLTGKVFDAKVRTLSTFVFAAILFSSPSFAVNITMTTLRHIEYPIGLLFIFMMLNLLTAKRKNYLYKTLGAASLLALLVLNDIYFLYTLVPASLFTVVVYSIINRPKARQISYSIGAVILGVIGGQLLSKLLTKLGLISIIPGYLRANTITNFEELPNAISIAIKQTFDLFGGPIFGQGVKLGTLTMFLFALVPIIAIVGMVAISKSYRKDKKSAVYFLHIALTSWLIFAYASYIFSGTVNGGTTRYLTLVVYIGITYFSWFVVHNFKKYNYMVVAACLVMVIAIPLGYPRVHAAYKASSVGSSTFAEASKKIATVLAENNIQQLIEPIGYSAINFHSTQPLNTVIVSDCVVAIPWANNAAWQYKNTYTRSALLFEELEYTPMQNGFCSEANTVKSYGVPEKIIEVPSIQTTKHTAKLYIYNYDIRTRIVLNPGLRH